MKNWSLNIKFAFVLSIFVTASLVIASVGIRKLSDINTTIDNITEVVTKRALLAKSMDSLTNEIRNFEKVIILEDTQEGMHKVEASLATAEKQLEKFIGEYRVLANEEGKKSADELLKYLGQWKPVHEEVVRLALMNKDRDAAALSRGKSKDLLESFGDVLQAVVDRNEKIMAEENARAEEQVQHARNLMLTVSVVALLTGLLLAFVILRAINRAIDQVIANLRDNSNQVTSAAQQIAASSEQLSQAATEQASSLEETSSSIEEMNSMIKKNSDNATKAADVSNSGQHSATRGKEVVGEMLRAIDEINESNNQISDIVKVIAEIENKTKVINDIVFKTQLLSFNASVEAARAGAHGKGFAVVAEEVGKLAQLSGNAAREISDMLATSVQKVNGLVTVAREKVKVGTDVAQQCGAVLEEIVGGVSTLNQMANEIASASQEQAKGIEEVTRAMTQLDQVTQENAATSEESASAAEELSAQAEALKGVVQVLIQTIKGGNDRHETSYAGHAGGVVHASSEGTRTPAKVLHIKNANARKTGAKASRVPVRAEGGELPLKKAVGAEYVAGNGIETASEDDPRFKDV